MQALKTSFIVLLAAAASLAHAGLRERLAERRAQQQQASWQEPGLHEQHLSVQGLQRDWLLYLPKGYDGKRPVPLVYAFHGGGGRAAYMTDDDRYGWLDKADREGFVVVFPSGYSRFPGGRLATWNAGGCCGDARDREVDDVAFVRAIHAEVMSRLPVQAGWVFATGMSNGAMMSHRLACEMSDVFAAVAPVAGTDATQTCRPERAVSVLAIHAKDDTHVLFNGGAGPDAFRDASKVMDFVSVPETVRRWTQRNQCDATPKRVLTVPGAQCDAYACAGAAVGVQLCVTDAGGHSWPGATATRLGKAQPSQAIRANDVIWAFFQQHHR